MAEKKENKNAKIKPNVKPNVKEKLKSNKVSKENNLKDNAKKTSKAASSLKKSEFQAKLGYQFSDFDTVAMALTHPSKSKDNYQRLEFLGDSILGFLVAEFLFKNSAQHEGELTVLRAHFVSEEYLSKIFDKLNLSKFVIYGKSLEQITRAIKGDVMEAIIAAIYLDGGMDAARKFVIEKLEVGGFEHVEKDNYKTQLQELVQANFKCEMKYATTAAEVGFESKFYMDEDLIATGYGTDKQRAEQNCAFVAIQKLFEEE